MKVVGFMGLNGLASNVAGRIASAGHQLTVWDRDKKSRDYFKGRAELAESPRGLAQRADFILMLLQEPGAVIDMCTSPQGIYDSMKPGKIVVSLGAISPSSSAQISDKFKRKGAVFLEAPVIGSAEDAERGELITLVGGNRGAYQEILEILKTFSNRVFYVGDIGSALAIKLALSVVVASYSEALGESLLLAKRAGAEPRVLMQVLEEAGKDLFKAELGEGEAGGLGELLEELKLAAGLAREKGAAIPVAAVVENMYAAAAARGLGDRGYRAIAQFISDLNGDGED